MKQPIKVVMLPTEDTNPPLHKGPDGKLRVNYTSVPAPSEFPQHTYITVPQDREPIKMYDYCLLFDSFGNLMSDTPQQWLGNGTLNDGLRKIIATTDPKLKLKSYSKFNSCCREESECHCNVPQLQQSFLKEFVANPNGEWEVEYDCLTATRGGILDLSKNPCWEQTTPSKCMEWKLKLNQDNTVNITSSTCRCKGCGIN